MSSTPGIKGLRRIIDAVVDASERVAQKRRRTGQPLGSLIRASGELEFEIDESGDLLFVGKARGKSTAIASVLDTEAGVERAEGKHSDGFLQFEIEVWCSPGEDSMKIDLEEGTSEDA